MSSSNLNYRPKSVTDVASTTSQSSLFISSFSSREVKINGLISSLRLKQSLPGFVILLVHLILMFQTILLAFRSDVSFGSIGKSIITYSTLLRTFGLQFVSYEAAIYITLSIGFVQVFGCICIYLSWKAMTRGSKHWNKIKFVVRFVTAFMGLISLPISYILVGYWDCNFNERKFNEETQTYDHFTLNRYADHYCFSTENIIIASLSMAILIVQVFFSSIAVIMFIDFNPKKIFSCDEPYFILYLLITNQFYLIAGEFLDLIPSMAIFGKPIVIIIISTGASFLIAFSIPFYHKSANCLYFALFFSRIAIGILSLITNLVNTQDNWWVGLICLGCTLLAAIVFFIIGNFAMLLLQQIIMKKVKEYEYVIAGESAGKIHTFLVDLGARIMMNNGARDQIFLDNLFQYMVNTNILTVKLSATIALFNVYFREETPLGFSTQILRRSFQSRPTIFRRFLIMTILNQCEHKMQDKNGSAEIRRILDVIRKKQSAIRQLTTEFWKNVLEKSKSEKNILTVAENIAYSIQDCLGIFGNLMVNHSKNPMVLRYYGNFIESFLHNKDEAQVLYQISNQLEDEEVRNKRKKLEISTQNKYTESKHTYQKIKNNKVTPGNNSPRTTHSSSHSLNPTRQFDVIQQEDYVTNDLDIPKIPTASRESSSSLIPEHGVHVSNKLNEYSEDNDMEFLQEGDDHTTQMSRTQQTVCNTAINTKESRLLYLLAVIIIIFFSLVVIICSATIITVILFKFDFWHIYETCNLNVSTMGITSIIRNTQMQLTFGDGLSLESLSKILPICESIAAYVRRTVGVHMGGDIQRIWMSKSIEVTIPAANVNSTSDIANYGNYSISLYDLVGMFIHNAREFVWLDVNSLMNSISQPNVGFIWINKDIISNSLNAICDAVFIETLDDTSQFLVMILVITSILLISVVIYIVIYFPLLYVLFRRKKHIARLFKIIPREITGQIYQRCKEKSSLEKNSNHTKSFYTSPKWRVYGCFFIFVLVQMTIVGSFIFIGYNSINLNQFNTEVARNGAKTQTYAFRSTLEMGELFNYDNISQRYSSEMKVEAMKYLNLYLEYYNWVRFGYGTRSGKGIYGLDREMDNLLSIRETSNCTDISCKTLHQIMRDIFSMSARFIDQHQMGMNEFDQFLLFQDIHSYTMQYQRDMNHILKIFSDISSSSESKIALVAIVSVGVPLLLISAYSIISGIMDLLYHNYQLRQLFHFVPLEVIENTPPIRDFIFNHKISTAKNAELSNTNKTEAILDGASDGVILCNEIGIVNFFNPSAVEMFKYPGASHIIGFPVQSLFSEKSKKVISSMIKEIRGRQSKSKAQKVELEAIRKDSSLFPILVSINGISIGSKVLISVFIRDITSEKKHNELLSQEKKKSENLLLNILPAPVASRLKTGSTFIAETFDDVTCLFSDMVGFTRISCSLTATEVVTMLNTLVNSFDSLTEKHSLEKIKTIGDAYFVVGGLHSSASDHPERVVRFAIDMLNVTKEFDRIEKQNNIETSINLRIGINTGSVIAGIIGKTKFAYDLWGDAVNTASRMESTGIPGRIQVTRSTYERVYDLFKFEERHSVQVKGKGTMTTYLLIEDGGPKLVGSEGNNKSLPEMNG